MTQTKTIIKCILLIIRYDVTNLNELNTKMSQMRQIEKLLTEMIKGFSP